MNDILIFLISFYFCLFSTLGYGNLFYKICYPKNTIKKNDLIYIGFFGLAFLTTISMISSIFVAHNFYHNLGIHFFGLTFFLFSKFEDKKNFIKNIFYISVFLMTLLVISKTNDETLEILEQIVPVFQPSYQMTIKLVDAMADYRDIPIILNSISYSDDYEGTFDDRKITLVTMTFTCKTYIFGPVGTAGPIKKAKVDMYTDMPNVATTRQVAYQVTPKALTDKNKDGTTELAGAITARNLSIEVADYSNIPTQSYIEVGNEVMYVKSKTSPNKLSVRRAQNGTTAASATAGTPIDLIDATDDALLTSGDDFGFSETTSYYE